jgi:hypothetical protein
MSGFNHIGWKPMKTYGLGPFALLTKIEDNAMPCLFIVSISN